MLVIMNAGATKSQKRDVVDYITTRGFTVDVFEYGSQSMIGVLDDVSTLRDSPIDSLPGVKQVVLITEPYKLVSRTFRPASAVIRINQFEVGAQEIVLVADIELGADCDHILRILTDVKSSGISFLRIRPSYLSSETAVEQMRLASEASRELALVVAVEVASVDEVRRFSPLASILVLGGKSMENRSVMRAAGQSKQPVIIERGLGATVQEWLTAAHLVAAAENPSIILCENGIRTFDTRPTLDINAVPAVKTLSNLPVLVDPGRAAGNPDSIVAIAKAAIAAGVDGVVLPLFHPLAYSGRDTPRLTIDRLPNVIVGLGRVAEATNRHLKLDIKSA